VAAAKKRSRFQQAVEATPGLAGAYKPGIQALEPADRQRIADKELARGSIFLDGALKKAQPNANRWDYAIGMDDTKSEMILWLEVHHAASGQADLVIKKLEWLKGWLSQGSSGLGGMRRKFVWLLSNVETNPNDRNRRNRLAEKHGLIRRQGQLRLREFV
jgi:hypothetical protein